MPGRPYATTARRDATTDRAATVRSQPSLMTSSRTSRAQRDEWSGLSMTAHPGPGSSSMTKAMNSLSWR